MTRCGSLILCEPGLSEHLVEFVVDGDAADLCLDEVVGRYSLERLELVSASVSSSRVKATVRNSYVFARYAVLSFDLSVARPPS
jgi:hypothetical protein